MTGYADDLAFDDRESEWPRFLQRDGADVGSITPPPLPHASWPERMRRTLRRVSRRVAIVAVTGGAMVLASAALIADGGWQAKSVPRPELAKRPRNDLAEALQTVAQLESRLGYAENMASTIQQPDATRIVETGQDDREGEVSLEEPSLFDGSDPVGLLILRNLPWNATFTAGASGGKGTWAMASGNPDQLATTLGEGFDEPVAAEVEMISRSGLALGSFRLELRKGNVAAQAGPEPAQKTASVTEPEKAEAKPPKRNRHAKRVHRSYKIAGVDRERKKRIRRAQDAWKANNASSADTDDGKDNSNAAANGNSDDAEPSGPIAKFFSWFKGSTSPSPAADDVAGDSKFGMFPQ